MYTELPAPYKRLNYLLQKHNEIDQQKTDWLIRTDQLLKTNLHEHESFRAKLTNRNRLLTPSTDRQALALDSEDEFRLSKRQSPTKFLFRTIRRRTIILYELLIQYSGSKQILNLCILFISSIRTSRRFNKVYVQKSIAKKIVTWKKKKISLIFAHVSRLISSFVEV